MFTSLQPTFQARSCFHNFFSKQERKAFQAGQYHYIAAIKDYLVHHY